MSDYFFYDINKKMADLAKKQQLTEDAKAAPAKPAPSAPKRQLNERDLGKHNNATTGFAALAKKTGGGEKGARIAGAQLAKMRAKGQVEEGSIVDGVWTADPPKKGQPDVPAPSEPDGGILNKKTPPASAASRAAPPTFRKADGTDANPPGFVRPPPGVIFNEPGTKASAPRPPAPPPKRTSPPKPKMYPPQAVDDPTNEANMPMTAKQQSFAALAPPADKITFADKIAGAKKEVDEMLGDVAAEAIKNAIGKKKEPRGKGTAFDPEVAKNMITKDPHPRYDVKDTGYSKRYTRKAEPEEKNDAELSDTPKKKGRPKGPEKGPER